MDFEVTAITPAYNADAYIEQTIKSVLQQTVPCKIIIVDDASKDNTKGIVTKYIKQNPQRVYCIENDRNYGVAFSRNAAVKMAETPYIAFLDADDWWSKEKIELQLKMIKETNANVCYSGRELMQESGISSGKYIQAPEKVNYQKLLRGNVISCSSVLMRKEDALQYPMVHDELHEDYIVWLSMLRDGKKFVGINQPLLKSRLGAGGKSRNKIKSAKMTYGVYRFMKIPIWKAFYYFGCYAWSGFLKYANVRKNGE